MAFNLFSLLGQQGAAGAMQDPLEEEVSPDIVVRPPPERPVASPPRYPEEEPERPVADSRYVLNDERIAPTADEMKEILPRRGMFGTKGTLRDIIGTLGDAFLVQGGGDAVYMKQRQQEKAGDAMFGASQDPRQAAERLAAQGYVKEAQELLAQVGLDDSRAATLASQEGARQDLARDRQFDQKEVGWDRVLRWTAGGLPYNQIAAAAAQYGLTPEELASRGITPEMTQEQRLQVGSGDVKVNQTQQLPLQQQRVALQGRSVANAERRTDIYESRPPQAPQPRAETDSDKAIRIGNKPPNQQSAGERLWLKRYSEGTGGKNSRGNGRRSVSPDGPQAPRRFRRLP